MNLNLNKAKSGFTLVEMLVAVAVFMVVVTSAVTAIYSMIDANKKSRSIKDVVSNVNFSLESISRDMRMGKDYQCADENGNFISCNSSSGNIAISFISNKDINMDGESDDKIWYRFVDRPSSGEGNIQRGYIKSGTIVWESLTAPIETVKINDMLFFVSGNSLDDLLQPKVFIAIQGESGNNQKTRTEFSLQTTISQRSRE